MVVHFYSYIIHDGQNIWNTLWLTWMKDIFKKIYISGFSVFTLQTRDPPVKCTNINKSTRRSLFRRPESNDPGPRFPPRQSLAQWTAHLREADSCDVPLSLRLQSPADTAAVNDANVRGRAHASVESGVCARLCRWRGGEGRRCLWAE